jgi:uncharacterized protein with HEPN domain
MSGKRDESLLLDDLIDATTRLIELGNHSQAGRLGEDRDLNERVMWNLVVLGEATKRLSAATRERFSDVPWSDMAETRDRVVHHYEGVDWAMVAQIIDGELPAVLAKLTAIRDQLRVEFDLGN